MSEPTFPPVLSGSGQRGRSAPPDVGLRPELPWIGDCMAGGDLAWRAMASLLLDTLMLVPRSRAYRPEKAHEGPTVTSARPTAAMKAGGVG